MVLKEKLMSTLKEKKAAYIYTSRNKKKNNLGLKLVEEKKWKNQSKNRD